MVIKKLSYKTLRKRFFQCLLACAIVSFAQEQAGKQEADLKAVFIYNFTDYTDWDTLMQEDYFVIGIIGHSDVTASLIDLAKTRTIQNKKILIKEFDKPGDITYTNVLFIPKNLPFPLTDILSRVNKKVLTISEQEGYAKLGTAFNFVLHKDKLRFESNLKSIDSAGLKVSAQLLKLAILVN